MKILYTQRILHNVPSQTEIQISSNWESLFYKKNNNKKIINELGLSTTKKMFPFLEIKLIIDRQSSQTVSVANIYFDVNIKQIENTLKNPINFSKTRKEFFSLIKTCHWERICKYTSELIKMMFQNAMNIMNLENYLDKSKQNDTQELYCQYHKHNLNWMLDNENKINDKDYNILPDNIFRMTDKIYIDIVNGKIMRNINKTKVKQRGGILISDIDYNWIYDFINLHFLNKCNQQSHPKYLSTNATLIVCDEDMCDIYQNKIDELSREMNKKIVVKILINSDTHDKLLYEDICNADFVIVNADYLISNGHKKIWSPYLINNTISLTEIFTTIREEYIIQKNIKKQNNPLLNMFWWNRIIVDDYCVNKMTSNDSFKEIIMILKSVFKWIQVKKFPIIKDDIEIYIRFIFGDDNMHYPIYDSKNKIIHPNNLININSKETLINEQHVCTIIKEKLLIDMTELEKTIYKNCVSSLKDPFKYISRLTGFTYPREVINKKLVSRKSNSVGMLRKKDKKVQAYRELKTLEFLKKNKIVQCCPICYINKKDNTIISCGHMFCTECIFTNTINKNKCPMCNSHIKINDLYRVEIKKQMKIHGSLNKALVDYLTDNRKDSVIITDYNLNYIKNTLEGKNFNCIIYKGMFKKSSGLKDLNGKSIKELDNKKRAIILHSKYKKHLIKFKNIEQIVYMNLFNSDNDSKFYENMGVDELKILYMTYKQ